MNLLPVIEREMLVEARHPATGYSRLFAPLLALTAFLLFAMGTRFDQHTGSRLFYHVHFLFFVTVWCVIPLLTADALSQERRENTLGLLFLANLSGRDVVLGKGCAHALRGLNLLLALVPFQMAPVFLGGVTWTEIVVANLVNVAAVLLALAAGLIASAVSISWWRAFPLALLFGAILLIALSTFLFLAHPSNHLRPTFAALAGAPIFAVDSALGDWLDASWTERLTMQLSAITSPHLQLVVNRAPGWGIPNLPWAGLQAAVGGLLFAGVLAWWILALAARVVHASWGLRPASARALRWQRYWFSPRFLRPLLQRRLASAMSRNPIGWLHQRSWKSRLLKWGWLLLIAVIGALLLQESIVNDYRLPQTLRLLGIALLASLAFTAATSFRRDLESGTLELLLVSPLSGRLILGGRVRGLVSQYLPAGLLLLIVWLAVYLDLPQRYFRLQGRLFWFEPLVLFSTAAALLAIGTHQSILRRALLRAWLGALIQASLWPALVASLITTFVQAMLATEGRQLSGTYVGGFNVGPLTWCLAYFMTQLLMAWRAWAQCVALLARREFSNRPALTSDPSSSAS